MQVQISSIVLNFLISLFLICFIKHYLLPITSINASLNHSCKVFPASFQTSIIPSFFFLPFFFIWNCTNWAKPSYYRLNYKHFTVENKCYWVKQPQSIITDEPIYTIWLKSCRHLTVIPTYGRSKLLAEIWQHITLECLCNIIFFHWNWEAQTFSSMRVTDEERWIQA